MRQNLEFYVGETRTFSGVLRNASGAVDLTSATLTWRLGDPDGRQTRLELTEGAGITVTVGSGGQWSVTIAPGDTTDLDPGYYMHIGECVIGTATHIFTQGRVRLRRALD